MDAVSAFRDGVFLFRNVDITNYFLNFVSIITYKLNLS